MNIDLSFVFELNGDGKTLVRDFLASPSAFSKNGEIIIIAIAIDIALYRHR